VETGLNGCSLHLIVTKFIISEATTTKTFNVTQTCSPPDLSVRRSLMSASEVTAVEFSTNVKVVSSSLVDESTVEGRAEVTDEVVEVKVVVVVVTCEGQ